MLSHTLELEQLSPKNFIRSHISFETTATTKNNNNNKFIKIHAVLTSASILVVGSNSSTVVDEGTVVQQKG